jgi:hypothetical protein
MYWEPDWKEDLLKYLMKKAGQYNVRFILQWKKEGGSVVVILVTKTGILAVRDEMRVEEIQEEKIRDFVQELSFFFPTVEVVEES